MQAVLDQHAVLEAQGARVGQRGRRVQVDQTGPAEHLAVLLQDAGERLLRAQRQELRAVQLGQTPAADRLGKARRLVQIREQRQSPTLLTPSQSTCNAPGKILRS
ncbi:hypothetical protein ACWC9T_14300 [Kitasatospora sp. NPDC001159]